MKIPTHVFHGQGFVYVEVPKSGCSSVKHALTPFRLGYQWPDTHLARMHQHFGYTYLDSIDEVNKNWSDYFKFTVVRHPVRRFVSLFCDHIDPKGDLDINEFILTKFGTGHGWYSNPHGSPQTHLVGKDLDLYDFVGRTEDMGEVEKVLCSVFGSLKLKHHNKSRASTVTLSKEAEEKLEELYDDDFSTLGY